MLPARYRLPREAFSQVYAEGKRYQSRFLRLRVLLNHSPTQPQWGIVVSKKVSKKAVERNRWKRQLRALIGALLQKQTLSGLRAIVSVAPGSAPLSFAELQADAHLLWQAVGWLPQVRPAKPTRSLAKPSPEKPDRAEPCREAHGKPDRSC